MLATKPFLRPAGLRTTPALSRARRASLGQAGGGPEALQRQGPLIEVMVGKPSSMGGSPQPIVAMVDTGASISAIDVAAAQSLGLTQTGSVQIGGVGGLSQQPVFASSVAFSNPDKSYDPIALVGAQIGQGTGFSMLIGRNILRDMTLVYDGKAGTFDLSLASGVSSGPGYAPPPGSVSLAPPGGGPATASIAAGIGEIDPLVMLVLGAGVGVGLLFATGVLD